MGQRFLRCSFDWIVDVLRGDGARTVTITNGIPAGAKVVKIGGAMQAHGPDILEMFLEHLHWPDAQPTPTIRPIFHVIKAPADDMLLAEIRRALRAAYPDRADVLMAQLMFRLHRPVGGAVATQVYCPACGHDDQEHGSPVGCTAQIGDGHHCGCPR